MKDLGEAKKILGMEITRDREGGKICLTYKQYLKKVLQCFDILENLKHVSTPFASVYETKHFTCSWSSEQVYA